MTVRAVRDGEPEGEISQRGSEAVRGREAGNAVAQAPGNAKAVSRAKAEMLGAQGEVENPLQAIG